MNVKEYISSGVIESYVMGLATDTERQEFETMAAMYPEIAEARTAFELALEEQLMKDAKQPPVHLKAAIEEKLSATVIEMNAFESEQEKIPVRRLGIWKLVAAASLLLVAATTYWAVSTNTKYKDAQAAKISLQNQLEQSTAQLNSLKQETQLLQKPGIKMAAMKGTTDPAVYATVYWDTASASKDVYLMINNLPQPASDKQYQLWALLNGKPIDLGMIEVKEKRLLYRMKNVADAQAFAITLEPKGGSAAPTTKPIVLSKL